MLEVGAERCVIWSGNGRNVASLTIDSLRELADSIIVEGGNRIPVIGRCIQNAGHEYELVTGTCRHWAISHLNAHGYPNIKLRMSVEMLTDEEAFRLADLENRVRTDISVVERARSYADALVKYFGGSQARMAEQLKLSKSALSKLLVLANLSPTVIRAFGSIAAITVRHGEELGPLLRDPETAAVIERAAGKMGRYVEWSTVQPAPHEVVKQLKAAVQLSGVTCHRSRRLARPRPLAPVSICDTNEKFSFEIRQIDSDQVDAIVEQFRTSMLASKVLAAVSK